jgi:hypothetical protein
MESVARGVWCLVDLAPPQEIIKASDPVPAIAIWFDDKSMLAIAVRTTVIFRQEVDQ